MSKPRSHRSTPEYMVLDVLAYDQWCCISTAVLRTRRFHLSTACRLRGVSNVYHDAEGTRTNAIVDTHSLWRMDCRGRRTRPRIPFTGSQRSRQRGAM